MHTTADLHNLHKPKEPKQLYRLLHDPLINVVHDAQTTAKTLPETYAALAADEVDDFPGLRPHQRHPWHATLSQIGAIAMINAGIEDPPQSPQLWLEMLRALTFDQFPNDEPWNLANPDITKPAFLQPGASDTAKIADYKTKISTPDEMDIPVGSKHHDVRKSNMRQAMPEQWLYALVARQTSGGFDGNKLYGTSRMNGGLGNRHGFGLTPSVRWGPHISRDLRVLALQYAGKAVKDLLLWTNSWDGTKQEAIPLNTLTPPALYIEASRRIRLSADSNGVISARYATSDEQHVHAKAEKGLTGDPWCITEADKAVTVSSLGFDYRQVVKYLDPGKYFLPELARHTPVVDRNGDMHLVARALVRGQGKTEGYHEHTIPLGRRAARMLGGTTQQKQLHTSAEARLKIAGEVVGILAHAAKTYLQGGISQGATKKEHQGPIGHVRRQMHDSVELHFWEGLNMELESEDANRARSQWCHERLVPQAQAILSELCRSQLCRRQDQYRAAAAANGIFNGRIRNSSESGALPSIPSRSTEETSE